MKIFLLIIVHFNVTHANVLTAKAALEIMKEKSPRWQQTKLLEQEANGLLMQAEATNSLHVQGYFREFGGKVNQLKFGFPEPGNLNYFTVGASGLLLEYSLYNPANAKLESAAKLNLEANKNLGMHYQSELITHLLGQYLLTQKYKQKISIQEQSLSKSFDIKKLAEAKVKSGLGISLDLLRANNLVEYEKLKLLEAKNLLFKARQDLAAIIGLKNINQPLEELKFKDLSTPPPTSITEIKKNRFDLIANEKGVEASDAYTNQYTILLSPKLTLFGDVGVMGTHVIGGYGNAISGSLGIQLELNFFDGSYSTGKAKEIQAKKYKHHFQARQLELDIETQYPSLLEQLSTLRKAIEVTNMQIESSNKELNIISQRYKAGSASSLEIVNAKTNYTSALEAQLDAVFYYEASKINYFKIIGKIESYFDL